MKSLRSFYLAAGICLVWLVAAPLARADQAWRTTLRLSEPTEIPGKILPAGDYVIKVVNTKEARSIVQFLDSKEAEVMATVLAVPNYRVPVPETTEFVYFRRAEGMPPALKSWVYPGNNYGVEFVYPKPEAVTLAGKTMEPVMAVPAETEPTLQSEVLVVSPEKKETPLVEKQARLPKTAGFLPLIALFGISSLAGAAGLRRLARRSS
jgi:hypothetical protein